MYFLKDTKQKIIFGWSGEKHCPHIKKIFYFFQNGKVDNPVHISQEYEKYDLEFDETYHIILFISNPYERIVGCFLHHYNSPDQLFAKVQWNKGKKRTFKNVVDELSQNGVKIMNKHHFKPQLSENWTDKIKDHEFVTIFDVENISYDFLSCLYDKKIPQELIDEKTWGERPVSDNFDFDVYNNECCDFGECRPSTKLFYTEEIKRDVTMFYAKDLEFFRNRGFSYVVPK